MNHVTLTDEERTEVLGFWGEYFRSKGTSGEPSAFQLDALNFRSVRDALMFWQVGGSPDLDAQHGGFESEQFKIVPELLKSLGEKPDPISVIVALTKLMKDRQEVGVTEDDIDTAAVLMLLHIEWLLIGGAFKEAGERLIKLAHVITVYMERDSGYMPAHLDPIKGLANAALTLELNLSMGLIERDKALEVSAMLFGVSPDDNGLRLVRGSLDRLAEKGGLKSWDLSAPKFT